MSPLLFVGVSILLIVALAAETGHKSQCLLQQRQFRSRQPDESEAAEQDPASKAEADVAEGSDDQPQKAVDVPQEESVNSGEDPEKESQEAPANAGADLPVDEEPAGPELPAAENDTAAEEEGNDETAGKNLHTLPFGMPFYLKSAATPEQYVSPEAGRSEGNDYLTFSGHSEGTKQNHVGFVAEDVGFGRFSLRSVKHPDMFISMEASEAGETSARLAWAPKDESINFNVERLAGSKFYLKSGTYADAYVQALLAEEGHEMNMVLGFAPFSNRTIQFAAEPADEVGSEEANEEIEEVPKDCNSSLVGGKTSKVIQDSAIIVSSQNPRDGNLVNDARGGVGKPHGWGGKDSRLDDTNSAWLPEVDDDKQWIQWDFGEIKNIRALQTLGRPHQGKEGDEQWVSGYNISYSLDKSKGSWKFIDKAFTGNHDRTTLVENEFHPPLKARRLRLHPTEWNSRNALRADVIGCAVVKQIPVVMVPAVPGEVVGKDVPVESFAARSHQSKAKKVKINAKKVKAADQEIVSKVEKTPYQLVPARIVSAPTGASAPVSADSWVPAEPGQTISLLDRSK